MEHNTEWTNRQMERKVTQHYSGQNSQEKKG